MSRVERRQARLGKIRSDNEMIQLSRPPTDEGNGSPEVPESQRQDGLGEIRPDDTLANLRPRRAKEEASSLDVPEKQAEGLAIGPRYVLARNQDNPINISAFSIPQGLQHGGDVYTKVRNNRLVNGLG